MDDPPRLDDPNGDEQDLTRGQWLNKRMAERGLRNRDLVKLINDHSYGSDMVARWTGDKANWSPDAAVRIARALGIPSATVLLRGGHTELAEEMNRVADEARKEAARGPLLDSARRRGLDSGAEAEVAALIEKSQADLDYHLAALMRIYERGIQRTAERGENTQETG